MSHVGKLNPNNLRIVLLLQGGGALGAYQAGVYQALHEHELVPDWIVGTSIGAINAALIAGNELPNRLQRIKEFWDRVSHDEPFTLGQMDDRQRRSAIWLNTMDTVARGVPGFFAPRYFSGFPFGAKVAPEDASFYDTTPLRGMLNELVDFDYLNAEGGMRLTVNAINVTSGQLKRFESINGEISADHVRASGSLPPGFAPVRIDGELYWDGGLYSNTPLESVLNELPTGDTLCFMVDLWSPDGTEPTTLDEVYTRQKDVTYASRSKRQIEDYTNTHKLQQKLRDLYARLPPAERSAADAADLAALGCNSTLHVVRLLYAGRDWNMAAKDVNFSRGSIEWRWEQGYADAMRALTLAPWLHAINDGSAVVVHELPTS